MATMLNVYDRATRKKTAVLQNAYNISETQEINQIYSLTFTLPASDEKNAFCLPRHFVRYGDNGELYRIKTPKVNDSSVGTIVYECEHVITTLCDDIMFGSYTYGGRGVPTSETISWILGKQKTANWRLGRCDFARQFEYNWEQENLLNALYSIPKEFASAYMWTFDTLSYPWTINLVEIGKTAIPEYYLRAKSNILSSGSSADYANICTRIYPLGYGEGVNQLTIKEATVNAQGDAVETGGSRYGLAYIQSPQSYIDKYGIVEKVLVDRRFEQPNTLYGYAKSMLAVYQEPTMTRTFDVTDLHQITNKPLDDAQVGKICKLTQDNSIAYITKTQRRLDLAGDLHIDLSTKASDIASNVADLADRIRIESVYSQGATQLYQHSKDANAAPVFDSNGNRKNGKGMVLNLYFPTEMKQINKVLLNLELKKFRSYSATTSAGGGSTVTSAGGGSATVTSAGGGSATVTSAGGGGATVTSAGGGSATVTSAGGGATSSTGTAGASVSGSGTAGAVWTYKNFEYAYTGSVASNQNNIYTENADGAVGEHNHQIKKINIPSLAMDKEQLSHTHNVSVDCGSHSHTFSLKNHTHNVSIGNHTHSVTIGSHTHSVSISNHTHSVTIGNHTHSVTIGTHTHDIVSGIFESSENPTEFDIYVNNTKRGTIEATRYNDDITQWLLNNDGLIPRGSWINIEIVPNTLAYVVSSVFVQGFVQSRGGGNY